LGLAIIFYRRQEIEKLGLRAIDWLAIFLSLFWLREVFNLLMSLLDGLVGKRESYFGGDELINC